MVPTPPPGKGLLGHMPSGSRVGHGPGDVFPGRKPPHLGGPTRVRPATRIRSGANLRHTKAERRAPHGDARWEEPQMVGSMPAELVLDPGSRRPAVGPWGSTPPPKEGTDVLLRSTRGALSPAVPCHCPPGAKQVALGSMPRIDLLPGAVGRAGPAIASWPGALLAPTGPSSSLSSRTLAAGGEVLHASTDAPVGGAHCGTRHA
jgi:hypothetical protein